MKNFKVGDCVFIRDHSSSHLGKIERVTPTGQIVVDGLRFDKNGHETGNKGIFARAIYAASDEQIEEYKKDEFIKRILFTMRDIKKINYEQAQKIDEILSDGDIMV